MTQRYWQSVGGTLIEEFTAVQPGLNHGVRRIDGVIVFDGHHRLAKQHEVIIEGNDIIVVQTKCSRLGMYLMGQAFFSRELMRPFGPRHIRTVALCRRDDEALRPLCDQYGIEVVVQEACAAADAGPEMAF